MESVFDKGLIDYQKELAAFKGTPEQQAAMVAKMSQAKKVQLFKTIEAIKDVNSKRDILKWFPDKGRLSRDKYPKHMEFIKAGAKYKERLFIAANRCLTYGTKVETPNGEVEIGKLYEEGKPFEVYAWDGEKRVVTTAEAPFKKPDQAGCVRWEMVDGRAFECSFSHRVLSDQGWVEAVKICCDTNLISDVGQKLDSYDLIGVRDVYDFTVPIYHNYFAAGVIHHNTGKSLISAFEVACHLSGMYPHWWEGKKFTKPVRVWVSSKTSSMTRDFIQRYLMGPWGHFGTGFIPGECFSEKDWTPKRGIPEAVDVARIHGMFGESEVMFKSYDQGWQSYQGTAQDVIWNDEECDELVHNECLTRLMTTEGIYLLTFTPLQGMTKVVRGYLGDSLRIDNTSKYTYVVNCTWDDVPHLSEEEKKHQWERTPPYLRDAKAKGIPSVGSGSIYPIPDEDIKIAPFKIPEWWPKCFAMDVGWNRTAALWGALDRESDTLYIYSEYYRGMAEPSIHADAIKARGEWIPGVIDPASRGRGQADGKQLFQLYLAQGLDIQKSKNAVESGIYEVWQRMSTGRLKVFANLQNFFTELRMYQRDINGKIVKENDHLVDCCRYMILSGLERATTRREIRSEESGAIHGFVPVDKVCGY